MTKIIPVAKVGKDPALASSFRPVSNLSVVGKLIERAVFNQIDKHITDHKLTDKDQHGGRKSHSTMSCSTEIIEDIKKAQEGKYQVALVALDLSAAYDMVDHGILLERCRLLNLCQTTQNFLRSFLATRSSLVELEGTRSSLRATGNHGVVQGGPSSGTLFNIYINDLPAQVNDLQPTSSLGCSSAKQYVDNGTIVARGKTLQQLKMNIRRDYIAMRNYLVNHRMVINGGKTQLMIMKPHADPDDLDLDIDGMLICHQTSIKILGVTISEELKFDEHVWKGKGSITRSVVYKSSLLRTLKPYLPFPLLCQVGNAILNSTIQYCAPLWGPSSESNRIKVQAAQVRAARIITGEWNSEKVRSHRQDLLSKIKWPNVNQIIEIATLNLLKNAIERKASEGLTGLFWVTKPTVNARRNTLRIDHFGPLTRSNSFFSANAVHLFNNLPLHMKNPSLSRGNFKKLVKENALENNLLTRH